MSYTLIETEYEEGDVLQEEEQRPFMCIDGKLHTSVELEAGTKKIIPYVIENQAQEEITVSVFSSDLSVAQATFENGVLMIDAKKSGKANVILVVSSPQHGVSGDAFEDLATNISITIR